MFEILDSILSLFVLLGKVVVIGMLISMVGAFGLVVLFMIEEELEERRAYKAQVRFINQVEEYANDASDLS